MRGVPGRRSRGLGALAVAVGMLGDRAADGAAVGLPAPPVPRFGVTVREVRVSVVAQAPNGQPVCDLRREDFALWDEGRSQTLTSFRHDTTADPPLPAPRPGTYSSRAVVPAHVTAVLFDQLNSGRLTLSGESGRPAPRG
jgi:hypothetical protein